MALNTTDFASGRLISELATATTSGVQVQASRLNGSYVTWPTGEFFLYVKRSNESDTFVEKIKVASGSSQNSTTGIVTLGTLTRNISLTDGSDATGTSATYIWPSGTLAYIGIGSEIAEMAVLTNQVNTMTGSGAIRSTSTTAAVVRHNSVTTAQRTAMSASNGDRVYDSDLGQHYKYEAGAWAAEATGTFSNAADGTAGKVDLATAAEVAAGTATDGTSGAPNVIPVSIVKTSSAGAVNGTIPALNASVALDRTIGGLGTTSGTAYTLLANGTSSTGATQSLASVGTSGQQLKSNGPGALPTFQDATFFGHCKPVFFSNAAATTVTGPAVDGTMDTHTYTIPANDLVSGVWYEYEISGTYTGTAQIDLGIALGSTKLARVALTPAASGDFIFRAKVMGTTSAGASVTVASSAFFGMNVGSNAREGFDDNSTGSIATNGTLAIQVIATVTSGSAFTSNRCTITKYSTTAFS